MDSESVILEFCFRYYLSLSSNGVQRAGDRALLISKEMEGGVGGEGEMCLSFWYYMHEPIVDNTGPNLGKLSAWVRSVHLLHFCIPFLLFPHLTVSWNQAKGSSTLSRSIGCSGIYRNSRPSGVTC